MFFSKLENLKVSLFISSLSQKQCDMKIELILINAIYIIDTKNFIKEVIKKFHP